MIILKIIVITTVILDIGSPAVQSGSDPVFELQCLTPECDSALVNDVYPYAVENQKIVEYDKNIKHSELYLIVVAVVTLLFSLIYYKYQNGTYENHLLTLLALKDQNLLTVERELILPKELNSRNAQFTTERNSEIESLNYLLTKSEDIILSQAIRIKNLKKENVELVENNMDVHTLLNITLGFNSKYKEQINTLKIKLAISENSIVTLTQKNFENSSQLEKEINSRKTLLIAIKELTNKGNSLTDENAKLSFQLEEVINTNKVNESKLHDKIDSLQFELDKQTSALVTAENEMSLSKETFQEVMSQKFNSADSKQFLSSAKSSVELRLAKQKVEEYKLKLNEALKSNQQFLDNIKILKSDILDLENNNSKLKITNEESVNTLNILKKFFKKGNDYWISFREAERKLKEIELQTAQQRNKLTMVDNGTKSIDSFKDIEDNILDIPLPTVCPDSKILFEPPPPIVINQWLPPIDDLRKMRLNRSLKKPAFRPLTQSYNYFMNRKSLLGQSVESLDK